MGLIEYVIVRIRDEIVAPNVGKKWVNTYTPLIMMFFLFIVTINAIGLIPIFDVLSLLNHTVLHLPEDAFLTRLTHGGTTPTGNFNVTAALATISFFCHHDRGDTGARLLRPLEEPRAARRAPGAVDHSDPASRSWGCSCVRLP